MITWSPTASSSSGTSTVWPSCTILWALDGMSLASSSSAFEAPITDLISSQWPKSMMSIRVASSQKKTSPIRPKTTALLYKYAVVIATAIKVIIPGIRVLISLIIPLRNG